MESKPLHEKKGQKVSLLKLYDPAKIEVNWQKYWLKRSVYEKVYKFRKDDKERQVFVIDTPPPFTSGELHIGHAYWNILNDTVSRYKRMRGYNVLLPQGWDCQGLPTELKVQNKWTVSKENRELFRRKCVEWTEQMIASMKRTMMNLGYRPDWEQFEYRTMDQSYWRIVQLTLLHFLKKGLIYRAMFPVHWCPHCETSLAQAELGYIEKKGKLYYVRFFHGKSFIEVATTRPELIPACQALAFHPKDKRYIHLKGARVEVPFFHRKVAVLLDENVDPDFGTGVVMVCTFGDEQDMRWQQKYGLPITKVVDEQGMIINSGAYNGLSISKARKAIVKDLKLKGYILKEEELRHKVLCHTERSDCMFPIEFLVKTQFFIKTKHFKNEVIKACEEMRWLPEYMFQRLVDWVNSIEWDWLISRQRIYGTPLPFWYCEECNLIMPAEKSQLPIDPTKAEPPLKTCPQCGSSTIKATEDVCDCWVDSSITPLIISGYFDSEAHSTKSYPTNIRQQGHDIIRTWLYYTTLRCLILTGKKPFQEVLVNGHILGPDGYRMSKSRGNVIKPEERINEYGADALRQALLSFTIGSDFSFNWDTLKYHKGFLQKYWSAIRFSYRFINEYNINPTDTAHLTIMDKWILSKLVEAIQTTTDKLDQYQFHEAIYAIQHFLWHDFCDQYLEAVKHRVYNKRDVRDYVAATYTLYTILWNCTLALAPFCPHITEEVYQTVWFDGKNPSVHGLRWPRVSKIIVDKEAKEMGDMIVQIISTIRKEKAGAGIPLSQKIEQVLVNAPAKIISVLKANEEEVKSVLHINSLTYVKGKSLKISITQ